MRRPARLRANVERSLGVAEHHAYTRLTRPNLARLVAAVCVGVLGLLPGVAHAATTSERVVSTTRAIDATAQRWFAAQADAARIDASIADIEHRVADAQAGIAQVRKIATARAVVMYTNADVSITSMFGDSAIDSARRAHLVDDADAGGNAAIAQLTASVDSLNAQRKSLEAERAHLQQTLREVSTERVALDAQLAGVRAQARHEASVALTTAHDEAARASLNARLRAFKDAVHPTNVLAAPTGPPRTSFTVRAVAAVATSRVSAHHDDPFLTCTRSRESAGRYDAVSPSGYYGAYQFLPSTWDSTAVHAGRLDLVGVIPSHASAYDQDETAWALYQWQGKGPWGGRC